MTSRIRPSRTLTATSRMPSLPMPRNCSAAIMMALSLESILTWAVASARMGTPPWVSTSGVRMASGTTSMGRVSTVSRKGLTNVPPPRR